MQLLLLAVIQPDFDKFQIGLIMDVFRYGQNTPENCMLQHFHLGRTNMSKAMRISGRLLYLERTQGAQFGGYFLKVLQSFIELGPPWPKRKRSKSSVPSISKNLF